MKIKRVLKESKPININQIDNTPDTKLDESALKALKNEIASQQFDKLRKATLGILLDNFFKKTSDDIDFNVFKNTVSDIEKSKCFNKIRHL
jgi:hypothetical protein